jgi:hypothetical protein
MTGYEGHEGPPFPLDLLADLHAGVLDDDVAAALRPRVEADAGARAILDALDATTRDLAQLPSVRMPEHVAARIDAALQAEATARLATPPTGIPAAVAVDAGASQPPAIPAGAPLAPAASPSAARPTATVVDLSTRRARRRRGLIAGGALLTAAAAIVAVVAVTNLTGGKTDGTPAASATNPSDQNLPPLALSSNNLRAALDDTISEADYGPLAEPGRLEACLIANKLDPATTKPLGGREVTIDGQPGVLMILPTGTAGRFHLLAVSPECGPNDPAVLANTFVP